MSSDRARKKHIYFVSVDTLVTVFRAVGLDDIVTWQMKMDSNGVRHITMASRTYPTVTPRRSVSGGRDS